MKVSFHRAFQSLQKHRFFGLAGKLSCAGLIFFSFAPGLAASAQEYHVQNWHLEDGLPDGEVTAIQQTPDGYLWIGTPKGLAQFDGTRFKVFNAASAPALTDSRITWLHTDCAGTLWVSSQGGNVARRQAGVFGKVSLPVSVSLDQNENRTPGSWLWERRMDIIEGNNRTNDEGALGSSSHLIDDGAGAIWWQASREAIIQLTSNSWKVFTPTNGLPAGGIRQMTTDHEGHVWVEAGGKLHRYDTNGWDTLQTAVPVSGPWPVLAPANEGGLWVAEPRGSWFLNGGQVRRFANGQWHSGPQPIPVFPRTSRSTVTCLMEDHLGRIWYGTAAGGVFFSDSDGNWHRLKSRNPFSQGYISCLFEDKEGDIWVGTVGDGLYRVSPEPVTMLMLPPPLENAEINTTFLAHDGAIWIGTGGSGVLRWVNETNHTIFGTAQGLANLHVCSIIEDSKTNVWVGTSDGMFQLNSGQFTQVNGPPEMSTNWVKALFEDHAGRLWIGTVGELICRQNGQFFVYHLRADGGYCDIRCIAEDAAGDLWIGTIGDGLFRLPNGRPKELHRVEEFPAVDARALFCDRDRTLWVGSWGAGLFQERDGKFTNFSTEDGLPSDRIQSIIDDSQGRLWLSTDNGIIGIEPSVIANYERRRSPPLWCQHLSLAEGLANRGCSGSGQPVCARRPDGRLWFPDYEGMAILNPQTVATKSVVPAVLVETVIADGKKLPLPREGTLGVSSSVRRFEFHFTAPDLALPQNLRFQYKLEGMDHDWVEAGAENVAYYSQLKPGQYQFRVMVSGSDGAWHGTDQVTQLHVIPRLWEQRWIQVSASALFIGLVAGSIFWSQRRKLRLQVERLEMQQAVETERRRIARDLHDELGARLTATALQGELAVQDGTISENAKTEIGFMSRRVRQLIGTVDEVVWTTDPENDSLPNLAAFLCDYMETFLAPTGISCRLKVAPDLPDLPLQSLTRRNLLLAFKEVLNNSVRHATPKVMQLDIYLAEDSLIVEISDDGAGFYIEKARPGGKGLSNIRNRMELIKGRVQITSEPGKGTTTSLSLPLLPTKFKK